MSENPETTELAPQGPPTLITELSPITQQVGSHVLNALQEDNCVAVISTIVPGFPTDRVVSVPLNSSQMAEVGAILNEVADEPDGPDDRPCIGFQCRLPGQEDEEGSDGA
jgi:hypothetical protein